MTRAAHNGHDWLGDSGIVEVPDEFKQLRRMLQKIADAELSMRRRLINCGTRCAEKNILLCATWQ